MIREILFGRAGLCFFSTRLNILKIYIDQYLVITYNGKEPEKEYIYVYIKLNHFAVPETNTML